MSDTQSRTSLKNHLLETYGPSTKHRVGQFEKSLLRRAAQSNHLIFNLRCKSEGLIPDSLRVRPLVRSTVGAKIAEKASRLFLMERIRIAQHEKRRAQEDTNRLEEILKQTLSEADFQKISQLCQCTAENGFNKTKSRHQKKLDKLKEKKIGKQLRLEPEYRNADDRSQWLVNLSQAELTKDEEDLLQLGLKFATSPKNIPYMDIAAGVEAEIQKAKLPTEVTEEITSRLRVCMTLRHAPKPQCNLTSPQRRALSTLKQKKNIAILKADKGNATVVMDKDEYHQKVSSPSDASHIYQTQERSNCKG